MVMLHPHRRKPAPGSPSKCHTRRVIVGVEIVRDKLRLNPEKAPEVVDPVLERAERFMAPHLADVVAQECTVVAR